MQAFQPRSEPEQSHGAVVKTRKGKTQELEHGGRGRGGERAEGGGRGGRRGFQSPRRRSTHNSAMTAAPASLAVPTDWLHEHERRYTRQQQQRIAISLLRVVRVGKSCVVICQVLRALCLHEAAEVSQFALARATRGERERDRDRDRDRETDRQRQTDRQRRHRERDRDRENSTEIERQRETETERDRDSTERDRQTDR